MAEQRAPGRYLIPLKHDLNRDNGCWVWHCRIEEVDKDGNIMQGPIQLHGGDTDLLNNHHDGKHENFLLNHVKPIMMKHYDDWTQDHSEAEALKGKSL